ncbi:MAG: hypothetical protein INR71_06100 [Terriglobus roseus]|nr:hypothetical protein [Terriglobus roseus]
MYWPYGSPRAFVEEQESRSVKAIISDDGTTPTSEAPGRIQAVNDVSHVAATNGTTAEPAASDSSLNEATILGVRSNRSGQFFITWTSSSFSIWNTKPTTIVSTVQRSADSLQTYGANKEILIRPDSAILVIHTTGGFLITYTVAVAHHHRVYSGHFYETSGTVRKNSLAGAKVLPGNAANLGPGEGAGVSDVVVKFRMVIKVDAGIAKALALDDELVVATVRPAAVQCIRWAPSGTGSQTRTELLARMEWVKPSCSITEMIHDRPMNLSAWVTSDGRVYAVQRARQVASPDQNVRPKMFEGYCFHDPDAEGQKAVKVAINARFSLIAVGCSSGDVLVYNARDYTGNIPLSHTVKASILSSAATDITYLSYSPDGYCMFTGFGRGWSMSSTYGKHCGSSFLGSTPIAEEGHEDWLLGVRDAFWMGSGSQLALLGTNAPRFWILELVRSAVTGCYTPANVSRTLLQTNTGVMVYRGFDVPGVSAITADSGLWQPIQVPSEYLLYQWPIRCSVISSDGRYVAVAGRRGLAHYSIMSARWKTFDDPAHEDEFSVRGGMCWHQHMLIAAVESNGRYQLRMYSREGVLSNSKIVHSVDMSTPVVAISPSGLDSLLVYTYENILHHFMITQLGPHTRLIQVGQIGLHGIIRAPLRVRAVNWILPEEQLENGDPAHDVSLAAVLFLVDGKLVLLNPATSEEGELKYEMRILAQSVEHYALMRDQAAGERAETQTTPAGLDFLGPVQNGTPGAPIINGYQSQDLRDSVWFFDGTAMQIWPDVQDVLASASLEYGKDLPRCVEVPTDFYPLSAVFDKGIIFGLEPEILQKRDLSFSTLRFTTRVGTGNLLSGGTLG